MKYLSNVLMIAFLIVYLSGNKSNAQDLKASNAVSWSVSGRVQLQHLYNTETESDAPETNNGFRIRRGRLQVKSKLTDWVSAKFQIEVRDNNPRLKDAEGKLKLFDNFFVRLGQFKIPIWREELRSSGKLLLVERSAVAGFLEKNNLSARHVGAEFGGKIANGVTFAINYSNGAGEGGREDAGQDKFIEEDDTTFISNDKINNGKLITGRINVPVGNTLEISLSGALNQLGNEIADLGSDTKGNVYVFAPDFGLYLPNGVDVEGGISIGNIDKELTGSVEDTKFTLVDITGRWKTSLTQPIEQLAGLDQVELAFGISYIEPDSDKNDDELVVFRFGPTVYFGKKSRLQLNGEIEDFAAAGTDTVFKIRTQLTINF